MRRLFVTILAILVSGVMSARAEPTYPVRPITIIVPYAAGGTDEFFAQVVAKYLTQTMGKKVIVEPVPGAGGNIGSARVARAKPNGYTLLAGTSGSNAVNPALYKNMPYNARQDLKLVATLATTENVLVVSHNSPFKSVKELIAYAKKHPGKLTYGSSGVGSVLQLSGAMLDHMAKIEMLHVPYKGTAPALIDVIGGRVSMMFANAPSVVALIKAGKLRALAVSGKSPCPILPDVPTLSEAGVAGYDLVSWFGVMAPSKTPEPIVERLNGEIRKLLTKTSLKKLFLQHGAAPFSLTAPQSEKFFLDQLGVWGKVVQISGASVN